MTTFLTDSEIRIVGSLMEKALSTPDYYPLSLNALTNACNQKSNRDPVVAYDESDVQAVLDELEEKNLVNQSRVGRVPKYEELFSLQHNLVPREAAVLCVLMLRGPQTTGEIRGRTGRLCVFENLAEVAETLAKLAEWGLVQRQARLPGHKESRYTHLLGGEPATIEPEQTAPAAADLSAMADQIEQLAAEVAQLRGDIETLKDAFQAFKAQFE
jgi:uncharacterized protein